MTTQKVIIIASIIIGLAIVGYGYMDYSYKITALDAKTRAEQKSTEDRAQKDMLRDACLFRAQQEYSDYWNANCAGLDLEDNCRLPNTIVDRIQDMLKTKRDDCIQMYK
jgi:hypothetical protein